MKFYVIEVAEGDAKVAGKGIYEYDSQNKAVASFHQKLGTAMKSELYVSDLVMVIDEAGMVYRTEKYVVEHETAPLAPPTQEA